MQTQISCFRTLIIVAKIVGILHHWWWVLTQLLLTPWSCTLQPLQWQGRAFMNPAHISCSQQQLPTKDPRSTIINHLWPVWLLWLRNLGLWSTTSSLVLPIFWPISYMALSIGILIPFPILISFDDLILWLRFNKKFKPLVESTFT